jgi:hypothetical protein
MTKIPGTTIDPQHLDEEMTRVLSMWRVYHQSLISLRREAMSLLEKVPPHPLTEMGEANPSWTHSGLTPLSVNATLSKKPENIRTPEVYRQDQWLLILARIMESGLPIWHSHVKPEEIEAWAEVISAAQDYRSMYETWSATSGEFRTLSSIYGSAEDTRDLIGTYVVVFNKRRTAQGWVVGGRGKTLYLHEDHMGKVLSSPGPNDKVLHNVDPTPERIADGMVWATTRTWDTSGKWNRANAQVRVLMPKIFADARKEEVEAWDRLWASCKADAEEETKVYREWFDNGGEEVLLREDRVANAKREVTEFDPLAAATYRATMTAWVKAVLGELDSTAQAAVRNQMLDERLVAIGGDLTVTEREILAKRPEGNKDIASTARDLMEKRLS